MNHHWKQLRANKWFLIVLWAVDIVLLAFILWGRHIVKFLGFWQVLVGAFLGAATPLTVLLLQQRREGQEKAESVLQVKKDYLLLLEKNIGLAINNLSDIDKMLDRFVGQTLKKYREGVIEDDKSNNYSVGQVFVPLMPTFVLDKDLLKGTTDSQYLESAVIQAMEFSHGLPTLMADINRQFERTISLNTQLGLVKVNTPHKHNAVLLDNLAEVERFLKEEIFDNNFPIYLRILVKARVALNVMQRWGLEEWARFFTYPPSMSPMERFEKMDEYFTPEINQKIEEEKAIFKRSRLILMEEKTPYEVATSI